MKNEWVTPEELAKRTGRTRQTINKWINREGWNTKPKLGVQGGKARVVYVDERVNAFLQETFHAGEAPATYMSYNKLPKLFASLVEHMSEEEQKKLLTFLLRRGVKGLLEQIHKEEQ